MSDRIIQVLRWPALVAGAFSILSVALSFVLDISLILRAAAIANAAFAVVVFLVALPDRATHAAVVKANALMRRKGRWGPGLLDAEWGFFGSAYADRPVLWANRMFFALFLLELLRQGPGAPAPGLIAMFAGFFSTIGLLFVALKRSPVIVNFAEG